VEDAKGARFKFCFASMDRPFLISAPPYGGGGQVSLEANAAGNPRFQRVADVRRGRTNQVRAAQCSGPTDGRRLHHQRWGPPARGCVSRSSRPTPAGSWLTILSR
jgi:hypothetical protein